MPWLVLPVIWSKTLYLLFVPSGLFVIDIQWLKDMYNKQGITAYIRIISSQEVTHAPHICYPKCRQVPPCCVCRGTSSLEVAQVGAFTALNIPNSTTCFVT